MKKIISVLLCIVMLIPSLVVLPVSAEYQEDEFKFFGPEESFWYNLTADGELFVSGSSGPLPDIHFKNCKYDVVTAEIEGGISSICMSAFKDCDKLREVKFTYLDLWGGIDYYAFENCVSLESIKLPYSTYTYSVYTRAFGGCTSLKTAIIPTMVSYIDRTAFEGCSDLTIVCAEGSYAEEYAKENNIPYIYCTHEFTDYWENDDVNCAGKGTMTAQCDLGCGAVDTKYYDGEATEHLGGSWTVTKEPTLTEAGEQSQTCDVCGNVIDVQPYDSVYGIITMSRVSGFGNNAYLYSDGTMFIRGTGSTYNFHSSQLPFDDGEYNIKHLVVEEGITAIGDYLLKDCSTVETVSLCEGITKIGKEAFYNCSSLASVSIPTTLEEAGSGAFYNCPELHTVYISDIDSWFNIYFSSGVNSPLGNGADLVLNGEKVTHLTVPADVATVNKDLFYHCTSLESVVVSEGVTNIEDGAFMTCPNLREITLPEGLTHIGSSAFSSTAFYKNTDNWTDGVLYIDSYLIGATADVTECHIAEGTTLVAEEVFRPCSNLYDISIPESVVYIGNNAFSCGYSYDDSNWENGALYIDDCLIRIDSTASKDFVIKEGTRVIGDLAFYFVSHLTSLTVPRSVTSIGDSIFMNYRNILMKCYKDSAYALYAAQRPYMQVEYICNHSFTNYISDSNATCTEDGTKTALCDGDCGKTDTVTDTGSALGHSYITETTDATCTTAGKKVTTCSRCGDSAVTAIPALGHTEGEWVVTKEPTEAEEGEKVLYCSVCNEIISTETLEKLPSASTDVDGGMLTDTVNWRLDENYTLCIEGEGAMPDYDDRTAFPWYSYRYRIVGLEISDGITHIGKNAFRDCTKITEIIIPDSVETIAQSAFQSNEGALSVTFGTGVKSVGIYCFKDCVKLKNVYISDVAALAGISFDDETASPLKYASNIYLDGEILTEAHIPGSVGTVGVNAFYNCTSLTKVTMDEGVTVLSNKAFDGCTSLTEVELPESLTTIGKNTFRNCKALTEIYIPSSVTSIDKYGFNSCSDLTILCTTGSYAESFAQTNNLSYTASAATPAVKSVFNYTVSIKNVKDVKEIRFAIGKYTTVSQLKAAEGNLTLSAAAAAKYIVDGVFTYDVAYAGTYTFCIRHNDGTNDFLYADVNTINTYLTSDGLRLTVNDMKAASTIKDMWIAEGTWKTYSEIKNNVAAGAKYQATSNKLANYFATNDFTYVTANPGAHTVLIRYNDGSVEYHHINLTVDVPTFSQNGLQLTIGNIPGVKIIRSAYGKYNSISEIKKAPLLRCFNNKSAIKDAESYKIQYRTAGEITVIVEYTTGYKHVEHLTIDKKESTATVDGNTVTIGAIEDGFVMVRYAIGKYNSMSDVKNAAGSKYVKAESVVDGQIVIEDLAPGAYTFCVQYDDESYNYHYITIA